MAERIHALKASNGHFARLVDEYHALNRKIHRVETRVEPTSKDVEEELKRRRVRLKDEIAQMLRERRRREVELSESNRDDCMEHGLAVGHRPVPSFRSRSRRNASKASYCCSFSSTKKSAPATVDAGPSRRCCRNLLAARQ